MYNDHRVGQPTEINLCSLVYDQNWNCIGGVEVRIEKRADFCVCGGGLAGVCAAVAAARNGLKVILCNDRAVLGGNSSSEFRVWVSGATGLGNNRYADECGIIGELTQESLYKNKEGNPYLWDAYILDLVKREPNIELLLNTTMLDAVVEGRSVKRVILHQSSAELDYVVEASLFADCTGNAYLAYKAGAECVFGSSDETYAGDLPLEAEGSNYTLGSTILFYKKKLDHEVKYCPPEFAYSKEQIERAIEETQKIVSLDMNGCDYWWLEFGGKKDTIKDSEDIQFELQRIVYGLWDYIKNSGKYDAGCYTLEWVGSVPGRRESRRVKARHTLTTEEAFRQTPFRDAVAYGGWPIDVHPSGGFFDKRPSCLQIDTGVYQIPLGSLCSADFDNLLLAGRNAGMTHGAMASARVMKTCALMGQAIGTAAALSVREAVIPAGFDPAQIDFLQQALLKDDVWLIDIPNHTEADLARRASISASGEAAFRAPQDGWLSLDKDVCIVLPPLPDHAEVMIPAQQSAPVEIDVEVYGSSKLQNHDLGTLICRKKVKISDKGQIALSGPWGGNNTLIKLHACGGVSIGTSSTELPGLLGVISSNAKGLDLFHPALESANFSPYGVQHLTDGFNRPLGDMHAWACPVDGGDAAAVTLHLAEPSDLHEMHLYFDNSLSRDYNNLKPDYSNKNWLEMPPNLARDFTVDFIGAQDTQQLVYKDNYRRHVVIYPNAKAVQDVRITIHSSWGSKLVSLFEVRLYKAPTSICGN